MIINIQQLYSLISRDNMHYQTYSYAISLKDQAAISDVTVMTITLLIVLAVTVYIIGKIK